MAIPIFGQSSVAPVAHTIVLRAHTDGALSIEGPEDPLITLNILGSAVAGISMETLAKVNHAKAQLAAQIMTRKAAEGRK